MKRQSLLLLLLLPLLLATTLSAQQAQQAPKTFELGAQVRLRGEVFGNLDLDRARDDRDAYTLSRVRLSALLRRGPLLQGLVELQDSRVLGSEASTASNEKNVDLHQGYLRIGTDRRFVRLGRQEIAYGEHRLVGNFDWDNVGRSFDGLLARSDLAAGKLTVDLFATKIRESPAPPERADFTFSGLHATARLIQDVEIESYLLDSRNRQENAQGDDRLTFTIGARIHGKWRRAVYDVEAAWQAGHEYAATRRAWMFAGYARWELAARLKPAIGFEWSRATGDGDPADGVHREFDNLFPTNHLKYGFLDLLGLRNNRMLGLAVQAGGDKPAWTAKLVGRLLAVDEPAGRWTSAGGAVLGQDPLGASGHRIGTEVDAILSCPVLPGLVAHLQGGRFRPGRFARAVRGREDAWGTAAYLTFVY